MKVQHFRANCLDSDLHGGVRGVVQDFTLIIVYIKCLTAHFRGNVWFRRSLSQRERFLSTQRRWIHKIRRYALRRRRRGAILCGWIKAHFLTFVLSVSRLRFFSRLQIYGFTRKEFKRSLGKSARHEKSEQTRRDKGHSLPSAAVDLSPAPAPDNQRVRTTSAQVLAGRTTHRHLFIRTSQMCIPADFTEDAKKHHKKCP